ncbi:HET-domain-containing protein [Pleurostoma richardsiae]|uniref:HET-domain-containing protein n=1 Tax=Pleurostoma richardsiae TaxID=41990 RepID=A0AA38R6S9_9PEZI|nr:HET-domain-containing protein [Pleurostoma richardsiae]
MASLYSHLDPEKSEIRVITLSPAKDENSGIQCSLRTVSLDEKPRFDALSYVWGDVAVTDDITVEGQRFPVTLNLRDALRHLRHPKKPRTLWIDAICINQTDMDEKSHQVPLMGRIYSEAQDVLVWLGPSTEDTELAISWAQTYIEKSLGPSSRPWFKLSSRALFSESARREKNLAVLRATDGFWDIYTRPYWTRMWTFQEFALPAREPVCYCGRQAILAASTLADALDPLQQAVSEIRDGILAIPSGTDDPVQVSYAKAALAHLHSINEKIVAHYHLSISPSLLRSLRGARDTTLAYLIAVTSDRRCGEPRDRFFALYGMAPAAQAASPVDYTKPLGRIALEVTSFVFDENAFNIYGVFGLHADRLAGGRYPSWAPDFGQTHAEEPNRHYVTVPIVKALYRQTARPRISADLRSLTVWGTVVGETKVLLRFADDAPGIIAQVGDLLRSASDGAADPLWKGLRSYAKLRERVLRAVVSHLPGGKDFSSAQLIEAVEELDRERLAGRDLKMSDQRRVILLSTGGLSVVAGRVLFITDTGTFGVGVSLIADGDTLTFLQNNTTPMALRRDTSAEQESFKMVGTAYVDGITEGECRSSELVDTLVSQTPRQFLLT